MYKFIIQKAIASLITLFIIVVFFYFVFVGVKGNPIDAFQFKDNPEGYEKLIERYGINNPVYVRFWNWLTGIFNGDWGEVYNLNSTESATIPQRFFEPLKFSMWIFIPSYFIGMFFGIGLGFWAGYKRGKPTDVVVNIFLTLFIAIPSFILAAFVLLGASVTNIPVQFQNPNLPGVSSSLFLKSLIPSILVVTVTSLAGWAYFLRNEVGNILVSDYILAVKTKGFSTGFIFRRYVLRNSLYPIIGSIVTSYMVVFSGSLVVERFFNVPGTSTMLLEANKTGEINILMFNLIFFSSINIFSQMLVDIVQFSINPIVKSNFSSKPSPIKKIKAKIVRDRLLKMQIKMETSDD